MQDKLVLKSYNIGSALQKESNFILKLLTDDVVTISWGKLFQI